MATVLTSDQVNYLIWRYLQECGYTYSVYAFQHETKAESFHDQYGPRIKPGSLISLIQRGLLYRELEFQINKDGLRKDSEDNVEPLFPKISKDVKNIAVTATGNGNMDVDEEEDEKASVATAIPNQPPSATNSRKHARGEDGVNGVLSGGEKIDKKKRRKTGAPPTPAACNASDRPEGIDGDKNMVDNLAGQSPPIEEVRPTTNGCSIGVQVETVTEITSQEAEILANEEQKVNKIAWSPVEPGKLVSGARSSLARIWSIPEGSEVPSHKLLDHSSTLTKKQEVTAVQWSSDGAVLATATFDGCTKLWNSSGIIMAVLTAKPCTIIDLRWNKASTILLSVYLDGGLLAWDVKTGDKLQTIEGKQQAHDVAWIDDETFAVATDDGEIVVYAAKTGEVRTRFKGDEGVGFTSLAWDESTERLASGDARGRIDIWSNSQSTPVFSVQAHRSEVSQLLWQPMRASRSTNSTAGEPPLQTQTRILASRSDTETAIKLWTPSSTQSTPILELSPHDSSVSNMCYSPDGKYLASGSYRKLYVWRVEDGFLSYVYSAIKKDEVPLTNGDSNGTTEPKTNGDVEMGGMDDEDVDTDTDSGKGGLDSFDISDISWDIRGTVVAIAIAGLGCVLVPIKPKPQTPQYQTSSPPLPAAVSDNGSAAERTLSSGTAETAITPPLVVNGIHPEEQVNGTSEKQTVR